jgi:hypothetical protein
MITILSTVISILVFRFRRRASLELELIGLRHQVSVLRRQADSALLHGPTSLGLALPGLAAGSQRPGVGKAGNRGSVASQRLPDNQFATHWVGDAPMVSSSSRSSPGSPLS